MTGDGGSDQVRPLRIALLGCGTVGSEVVRLLHSQADDLTARIGAPLELVGIAVRRPTRARPSSGCCTSWDSGNPGA